MVSLIEVPVWEKITLTVEEAAAYSNIGINKIRELMDEKDCDFVLSVGIKKNLIKRIKFERYITSHRSI